MLWHIKYGVSCNDTQVLGCLCGSIFLCSIFLEEFGALWVVLGSLL